MLKKRILVEDLCPVRERKTTSHVLNLTEILFDRKMDFIIVKKPKKYNQKNLLRIFYLLSTSIVMFALVLEKTHQLTKLAPTNC